MGWRRAWVAVVTLGTAGTAAAQTGAPAGSAAFPPAPSSAPAASPSASAASSASAPARAPTTSAAAPAPSVAPSAGPPAGYAPYPYPYSPYPYPPPYYYPYPPPYYYPWPPPDVYPPKDTRPRTLPYVEGRPPPPGYHVESGVRRGPVIAGSLMFGITYGLQVLVASAVDFEDDSEWLLVPVIGSWVFMNRACDRGSDDGCSFLVLHGITQASGAALLVYGLASEHKRYVRDEVGVKLSPARIGSGYGFSAVGRF